MSDLDLIDLKLLELLQQNGKLSTKEIAKHVNLSPTPDHERIRRLEREGIIKKYEALVETEKVGNGLIVFCGNDHQRRIGIGSSTFRRFWILRFKPVFGLDPYLSSGFRYRALFFQRSCPR